jgi:GTP-binding protein YchF
MQEFEKRCFGGAAYAHGILSVRPLRAGAELIAPRGGEEVYMGLAAGIIGLPNVGKSTIFNALSAGKAAAENYPFCTIEPNHGIVAVPDKRLEKISGFLPAQKVVPAFLELVDIAGLVKGASKGEGLGNQFLGHIKNVDAVVHVVRCFEDPDVVHVDGAIDPVRDIGTVQVELMLADLDTVERALAKVEKAAKTGSKEAKPKADVFGKAREALARGIPVSKALDTKDDRAGITELCLLTAKPVLYVLNVDEGLIPKDNDAIRSVRALAAQEQSECIKICGKIEAEIAELPENEQNEFLDSLGLAESGLASLAKAVYRLLGLQTFFTVSAKENRAWTIKSGATAPVAAGTVHTDFEKGFIKADVYTLDELLECKSEAGIRAAGKMRSEGHDYVVKDGDILFFRFNT